MRYSISALLLFAIASCTNVASEPDSGGVGDLTAPSEFPDAVHEVLGAATQFEIYALHPAPYAIEQDGLQDAPLFHEYAQLGNATVTDAKTRLDIISTVYRGIRENEGLAAACFNPRHGIRAESGGKVVDFVICFECLSMHIYLDGKKHNAHTSSAQEPALTRIWNAAGLTIHSDD